MNKQAWLLVANGSQATIYKYLAEGQMLEEIGGNGNGTRRYKDEDLVTDRPGVMSAGGSDMHGQSAMEPSVSPTEKAKHDFAKQVIDEVENARCKDLLSSLDIIAAPEMLGLLRDSMNKNLLKIVDKTMSKDGVEKTKEELLQLMANA